MQGTWITDDHWICTRHMRPVRLPATVERCYYANCSRRPAPPAHDELRAASAHARRHEARLRRGARTVPLAAADEAAAAPQGPRCAWHECDQAARAKSKYCSRECSNKNARHRHAQRGRKGGGRTAGKGDASRHAA